MEQNNESVKRRQFLKTTGAASAALGSAGLGFFGYAAGKDPKSYTGWQTFEGADQDFDRKAFETESPTYEKTGPSERVDARTDVIFDRRGRFRSQYMRRGVEGLDDLLSEHYRKYPEDLTLDISNLEDLIPKFREDSRKFGEMFILSSAWSSAMGAVSPRQEQGPPEEVDFPRNRFGERIAAMKMKSPAKTSKLIKKISHELGSTLVGITKLNHDWVYSHTHKNRGFNPDEPLIVPEHWQYAVVVGSPMSWDPMYANPNYGTSNDAYSRSRIIAHRLASFIRQLGYAARTHSPPSSYDLMVPPICVDAGLGEQGRHGVVITPELGCNFRPAIITTNIPLKPDKPIDFGVQDFCRKCKICAENCPSQAITFGDKEEVRGYKRYRIKPARCHNFWNANLGNLGCRICIAVCPYTKKTNWLHRAARTVSINDPTGLSDTVLTKMQKAFYPGPETHSYFMPSLGGENASYREPPWWLKTEDFIDL